MPACARSTMAGRGFLGVASLPRGKRRPRNISIHSSECQWSRLGNNLNQIARRLNTVGMPAPPTLEPLLRDIRRTTQPAGR